MPLPGERDRTDRSKVTDPQRVVILQHAIDGHDATEIAARLNIERASVAAVLGFCGWPRLDRVQAALDRLSHVQPVATVIPLPKALPAPRRTTAPDKRGAARHREAAGKGAAERFAYQRKFLADHGVTQADVRKWAADQLMPVSALGAIPRHVLDAYANRGA